MFTMMITVHMGKIGKHIVYVWREYEKMKFLVL